MEAGARSRVAAGAPSGAPRAGLLSRLVPGLAVVLAGLAPFLLARFAWRHEGGELVGGGLVGECPMLELTGLPCIGCGGARAFYHLTHGDGAFLDYNWFWPLAAAVAVVAGGVLVARGLRGERTIGARARALAERFAARPVKMAGLTLAVCAVPWLVAMANLDAIKAG
jgi:hypothetical protein